MFSSLEFDGVRLQIIDQTKLPNEETYLSIGDIPGAVEAIKKLRVRGAPAIACFAAASLALEAKNLTALPSLGDFGPRLRQAFADLLASRPTAVDLANVLGDMRDKILQPMLGETSVVELARAKEIAQQLQRYTLDLFAQHRKKCEKIAAHGLIALRQHLSGLSKWRILTHCNTGALATVGEGTALAVVKAAWRAKLLERVFVDETRPLLQGSRLTAYELKAEKIPFDVITDSMAGFFMSRGEVDAVIVGADRITCNGDFANKIGTMSLALLAAHFKVPFFVAAPLSTFDVNMSHGLDIPIEFRAGSEVLEFAGRLVAPLDSRAISPAFDVTPGYLVRAFVTDTGVCLPPFVKGSVQP